MLSRAFVTGGKAGEATDGIIVYVRGLLVGGIGGGADVEGIVVDGEGVAVSGEFKAMSARSVYGTCPNPQ